LKFSKILILLLFLYQGNPLVAQPDSIWALSSEKQVVALWNWYNHDLVKTDSHQVITSLHAVEKLFAGKGNTLLREQTWMMQHLYNAERNTYDKGAAIMLSAANIAAEMDWKLTQAECWHYAGSFYYKGGAYTLAFEYLQKAQHVFDTYDIEKYPHIPRYADGLAVCYYHFGEYREAIKYLKKTVQAAPQLSSFLYFPSIYNTMALCYQHLKQYDSAVIWYNKSYESAAAAKDSFYMTLAYGNLGYTYYLQEQYNKALPLMEADYISSMRAMEPGSATNAAMTMVTIYLKKGILDSAEKYMDLCRGYILSFGSVTQLKNWYENLYSLSKARRDNKSIALYADSLLFYKDSMAVLRDKKAFNQAVLRIETEQHMNEVNLLESKQRQQILLRNSLLAVVVLLGIIALLWVNRQLLKRNKEKELVQKELQFAEHELMNYTQQLKEKNTLLDQLRNEINIDANNNERVSNINSLLGSTILTEDDWKKFRQLFEKVYPGFFVRLKEKMPDLSATDTRLLALTKLQLPPKDMASMLAVSYDAIKKARQRLRKKVNLPEEGDLQELADMI
jgi:tetratricopeptide (TPR) repeat protein